MHIKQLVSSGKEVVKIDLCCPGGLQPRTQWTIACNQTMPNTTLDLRKHDECI